MDDFTFKIGEDKTINMPEKPNFDVYPSLDTCGTYFSDNCITTRNRLSTQTVEKI